jgi:hypothetical protein
MPEPAVRAGVELEPEQAQGVQAHADAALGVAGLVAQQEALGPLLRVRLAGAALAIVTVEVEVAQFQAGLAVADEVGLGAERQAGGDRGQRPCGKIFHCCCLFVR